MIEFGTALEMREWSATMRRSGLKMGFAPTMGALHEGHMSLVRRARGQCDVVISSIFVNPTQFNDISDYEKYPVSLEADREMLENEGCDAVFIPAVSEIYPQGREYGLSVDLGYIGQCMEAARRPGHFEGVMQVVKRLLDIVSPDVLYLGRKDYQQYMVVCRMVEAYQLPVRVEACPIIRESDGLAMSSRNRRLSGDERAAAVFLSTALFSIRDNWRASTPSILAMRHIDQLEAIPLIEVEYLEIADSRTLRPVRDWKDAESATAFIAAFVGGIRLIDNVVIY